MKKKDLVAGWWAVEWQTKRGVIREEIVRYGLHDKIMAYPVISMAVLERFSL